jgi:hypothetical protein
MHWGKRHEPATAWRVFFLLALVVGIFLRCYQLGTQILLDDEWHAINKLLHADAHDIATHLGLADYSIPLTLYYRFLYLHGGLSEWGMRLPMLLAGIGLLVVAPWSLRRQATPATLAVWTALLAISPLLIYLTRTARPYAITNLLVFVAVIAFRAWWLGEHRRRWAAVYILSTALAAWLHLITLPFTLLPFAFFGLIELRELIRSTQDRGWHGIGQLLLLGLLTALLLAVALLPPMLNDWGALAGKAGSNAVTAESAYRTLLMGLGISSPGVLAALALLLAYGVGTWWRRDRLFVAYIVTIVVGSAAAIALSHPAWIQHPGTYARYLQPCVPFLLLFIAEGLAAVTKPLATVPQIAVALVTAAALIAAGPLPGYLYNPNQFMGHPYFQFDYDPAYNAYRTELPPGPIPGFYARLASLPPRSLTLVEAPWSLETDRDPQALYQKVHHQYVRIGLTTPWCAAPAYGEYADTDAGMRLTQFIHLSTLARLGSMNTQGDADFLVVHLQSWPPGLPPAAEWPDLTTCLPQIESHFGEPVYRDAEIEVFALSPTARALPAMGN